MRLACYGWVAEQSGSVASANYLVVQELLRRGVEVDFYANQRHVADPGFVQPGFRYLGFEPPRLYSSLPPTAQRLVNWSLSPVVRAAWRWIFEPAVESEHRVRRYDAVLSLGTPPAFTLAGVPTATWVQAAPRNELDAILRLRRQISQTSGRVFWLALAGYYLYDELLERHVLGSSDMIVCPSEWSRRMLLARGLDSGRTLALPYPIDLAFFHPPSPAASVDLDRPIVLHLGRLDPRKRLDLLLASFSILADSVPGARLRIVGRPGYAPRQLSLLHGHPLREQIEYRPGVPRDRVPRLMSEAALLVQTSENENFGSSVAEALACGIPVVVGPRNGTADYVGAGGVVFGEYEPKCVAQAILASLERRRARPAESAAAARAAAERHVSSEVVVDGLLRALDRLISGAVASVEPPLLDRKGVA
jgi:glycosyltransferase involved in cell wall biosynthesis